METEGVKDMGNIYQQHPYLAAYMHDDQKGRSAMSQLAAPLILPCPSSFRSFFVDSEPR